MVMTVMTVMMSAPAQAQLSVQARHPYHLPRGPLDALLLQLASDNGIALAYDPRMLAAAQGGPVNGTLTPAEALARALDGTGFVLAERSGAQGWTIRRVAAAVPKQPVARPQQPPRPAPAILAEPIAEAPPAVVSIAAIRLGIDDSPSRRAGSSYTISGAELEQQHVTTLPELQQLVPGLFIQNTDPSDMQITIRGVGDGGGQAGGEANIGMPSSVAVYLDNVYLARAGMLDGDLADLASAEVLSGAQGTLFGANATGGVVDLHTRAPSFRPEGSISIGAGQHGNRQALAVLSGPLSEDWAGRLNLSFRGSGGDVFNVAHGDTLNGTASSTVRGQLLYRPRAGFSLRLSADYGNSNNSPTAVLVASHAVGGVNTFLARSAAIGNQVVTAPNVDLDDENRVHLLQGGVALEANWVLDGYKLRAVTSMRYFRYQPTLADNLSVPVYANSGTDVLDRTWSQDIRLDSPRGAVFDYALGGVYLGENLNTLAHQRYADSVLPALYYANAQYRAIDVVRRGTLHDATVSPFARGTWHVTPQFDASAGLRLGIDHKGGQFVRTVKAPFDSAYLRQDRLLPSATAQLDYRLSDRWQADLALSYGEKSGGINVSAGGAAKAGAASLLIAPERSTGGELGIKGALSGGALQVKADMFVTDVAHFQTQRYDAATQQTYLTNAGRFLSRGAETSLAYKAGPLQWQFNAVFNDARYRDYQNAICPPEVALLASPPASCNLTGHRVFNTPRASANTGVLYGFALDDGLDARFGARYAWRGWTYGTVDDSQFTRQPAYGLLALSAAIGGKYDGRRWDATLWLNNALNKVTYRRLLNGDFGAVYGWRGDPRTLGLTVTLHY
jgi:iron complex outermembrane receptor protein